jgi:hypothetical protein
VNSTPGSLRRGVHSRLEASFPLRTTSHQLRLIYVKRKLRIRDLGFVSERVVLIRTGRVKP